MIEIVVVVNDVENIDDTLVPIVQVRRIEFDTREDFETWYNKGLDEKVVLHESKMRDV